MNSTLIDIISYSIAIGAIIGLIRVRTINQTFLPFIILLWIGLLNEILGTILIRLIRSNAVNSNIYVLIESLVILKFFNGLGLFDNKRKVFFLVGILFITTWIADNFFISNINRFSSYFRVFYSIVIVFISIQMINRQLTEEKKGLLKNPVFLIMMSFITFFTCKILIEIFWIYGLNASKDFRVDIYRIMTYVNLITNITYALAVIWIPRKREYTLL